MFSRLKPQQGLSECSHRRALDVMRACKLTMSKRKGHESCEYGWRTI